MKSSMIIPDEQRRLQKTHLIPAMVPKLPSNPDARRRLGKNLEYMGLGNRILNFPWTIVNQAMVDELTQNCLIPDEVPHYVQRGALHHITKNTFADIYGTSTKGDNSLSKSVASTRTTLMGIRTVWMGTW
jgi:hypothetical protein